MIKKPQYWCEYFVNQVNNLQPNNGFTIQDLEHELLPAPHKQPSLPNGKCAVYVFSLKNGIQCLAGANRVLKVGRVGPNSEARFCSQHYKIDGAPSTLAKSLKTNMILWPYLGIPEILDYGLWLMENTDRDHFFLDGKFNNKILPILETCMKGVLGPVFEG